jgi:hypothetical protein
MTRLPLPSLAAIAFNAAKRKAAAQAQAERTRQLYLEQDLRYCPGLRDPRLVQTADDDDE